MREKMRLGALAALLLGALAARHVQALSLDSVDVNTGVLLIGTDESLATEVAPNPAVATTLGASFPLTVVGPFFLEPALDLFIYDYTFTANRAVPANSDAAAAFLAVGSLLSMQGGVRFTFAGVLQAGTTLGLDALLRFPVWPYYFAQVAVDAATNAWPYFFGAGRFLYPEARVFLRWQIVDTVGLVFSVRAFYPLAHFWDGLNRSFWDELMVSGTLGFSIRLGGAAKPQPAASGSPATEPAPADQPAASGS